MLRGFEHLPEVFEHLPEVFEHLPEVFEHLPEVWTLEGAIGLKGREDIMRKKKRWPPGHLFFCLRITLLSSILAFLLF